MEIRQFLKIINGSKEFRFYGSVLEVKGYYTGETVKLDLARIDEEMLDQLIFNDEDDDDEEEDYE